MEGPWKRGRSKTSPWKASEPLNDPKIKREVAGLKKLLWPFGRLRCSDFPFPVCLPVLSVAL